MRCLILVVFLATAATSGVAQVISRPTDPPIVTAENESWYRLREPLVVAGDRYFPAGPVVFFNGNTMVRTGHYNGVPLYADTTIEPYSIVYVPIGRGLMQPYERVRRGDLAGTTGSRLPSFPPRPASEASGMPMAAVAPTGLPQPIGAISAFTPETGGASASARETRAAATPLPVGTGGVTPHRGPRGAAVETVRRAESNDGVWLAFMGARWVSAGPAVPLRAAEFVKVGEYRSFPVFARTGLKEERIYLPSAAGFVAPFRLKE